MGKQATVRVTQSNLYRTNKDGNVHRCAIGERFTVTLSNKGEIPLIYRGKVELDDRPALTTDQAAGPARETGADADEQRRQFLLDEIEQMSGTRPGARTKLETLETKFEEAKLAEKD
ncbi:MULTISPECIES: hypothetical protein [unclassified Halomonas]|uniref:hypothetical protein n=1 Tax=unclassified Halomonas TaxID=2609666 RepID=UPI002076736C|nr:MULTISPECIES: hypothetical protein [unclassified Halomonas]